MLQGGKQEEENASGWETGGGEGGEKLWRVLNAWGLCILLATWSIHPHFKYKGLRLGTVKHRQ